METVTLFSFVDAMVIIWLLLTIAFVIGELVTVGLTSIWFAAGSLVALLAAICDANIAVQVILFLAVSIGLLVGTRPWAKRFINSRTEKTNADRAIGQIIRITERVSNMDQTGKAVVSGQEWTVRTRYDNEVIEEGASARVLEISGVKLIVEKV
ncbi:MAG: NfeD family protein [Agathobacter sp.]|nr:NfeD family protein [Agathobacter sp.]